MDNELVTGISMFLILLGSGLLYDLMTGGGALSNIIKAIKGKK